jgi:PQ loop repeat
VTVADITLAVFTLCNSLRVLAYVPQIAKAAADRSGAEAISFSMWGLFLLSNMSAVAYAVVNRADWTMAAMFLGNAVGCATILLISLWKRAQHRNRFLSQAA